MPGRGSSDNRCVRCRMYRPLCLCAHIPVFNLKTKIMVVMHWREQKLTTNTAGLACLALPNSEIHVRGREDERLLTNGLIGAEEHAAILFPAENNAIELNEESVRNLPRPLTLIVPDGSWRQAKKVALREKAWEKYPRLTLPPGAPSIYSLRHSPHEENLSTFEAIARAIGILEGKEIQEKLEDLFLMMVERILWSRGNLKAAKCTTGIPEEAFILSRLAGIAGSKKV
ncbi:MAG: tRNA-uridine aminocarboxypropyltransferase [Bdellovibrionia bacterium]